MFALRVAGGQAGHVAARACGRQRAAKTIARAADLEGPRFTRHRLYHLPLRPFWTCTHLRVPCPLPDIPHTPPPPSPRIYTPVPQWVNHSSEELLKRRTEGLSPDGGACPVYPDPPPRPRIAFACTVPSLFFDDLFVDIYSQAVPCLPSPQVAHRTHLRVPPHPTPPPHTWNTPPTPHLAHGRQAGPVGSVATPHTLYCPRFRSVAGHTLPFAVYLRLRQRTRTQQPIYYHAHTA